MSLATSTIKVKMWQALVFFVSLLVVANARVLVLGSGGLIGTALTGWLRERNFEVAEVVNRTHIDLRVPGALDQFTDITFVYFLACEVGGAKYINTATTDVQREIVEHNVLIYQTVFEWLSKHRVPFVFTSSYLQGQDSAYGAVKRLGEQWIRALGYGVSVRLWNIYGPERLGPKSHVLGDWIDQCLRYGHVQSLTNGHEYRQFLHVEDTANGLGLMMRYYDALTPIVDLAPGVWHSLRQVGEVLQDLTRAHKGIDCPINWSLRKAVTSERIEPNLTTPFHRHWQPVISLEQGLRRMMKFYEQMPKMRDEL